jgi:hypothetical protein
MTIDNIIKLQNGEEIQYFPTLKLYAVYGDQVLTIYDETG